MGPKDRVDQNQPDRLAEIDEELERAMEAVDTRSQRIEDALTNLHAADDADDSAPEDEA